MKTKNKYKTYCCILTAILFFLNIFDILIHLPYNIYTFPICALSPLLLLLGYLKFFDSQRIAIFLLSPLLWTLSQLFYEKWLFEEYGAWEGLYSYLYISVTSIFTGIILILAVINCVKTFKYTKIIIVFLSIVLSWECIIYVWEIVQFFKYDVGNFVPQIICSFDSSFILIILSLIVFHLSKLKRTHKFNQEFITHVKTKSSEEYLYELKQLKEANQISEEEYQKRKADLLSKI